MFHGEDLFDADELEALLLRRHSVADHDDESAWLDLGLLVRRLMAARQRDPAPPAREHRPALPSQVLQYWDQPTPPLDVAACMASWERSALPIRRFDRAAADAYLDAHFGGDVLASFRHAHHPAMQADLFRLACLLREGGLYVDADDAFINGAGAPACAQGIALMPLAVSRASGASLPPRVDDPDADGAWYYLGNAPIASGPGHRLLARALDRAVASVMASRRLGELSRIHRDTGPGSFSMAALDHAVSCLREGNAIDLAVSASWPFLEQSRDLAYKRTARNWRTNAVLYGSTGTTAQVRSS